MAAPHAGLGASWSEPGSIGRFTGSVRFSSTIAHSTALPAGEGIDMLGGVMFVSTPHDQVLAINAKTGALPLSAPPGSSRQAGGKTGEIRRAHRPRPAYGKTPVFGTAGVRKIQVFGACHSSLP
jgi:hypothetical protein